MYQITFRQAVAIWYPPYSCKYYYDPRSTGVPASKMLIGSNISEGKQCIPPLCRSMYHFVNLYHLILGHSIKNINQSFVHVNTATLSLVNHILNDCLLYKHQQVYIHKIYGMYQLWNLPFVILQ